LTAEVESTASIPPEMIPENPLFGSHLTPQLFSECKFRGRDALSLNDSGWTTAKWHET
jgi:hypothetical protein